MRIKNHTRNFLSLAIAAIFLLSSGGFKIYLHHCLTEHKTELSLFTEQFNCHHHHSSSAESSTIDTNCCGKSQLPDSENNCCHTNAKIFKISDSFNSRSEAIDFDLAPQISEKNELVRTLPEPENQSVSITRNNTPPPNHGVEIVIFIRQIKIGHTA